MLWDMVLLADTRESCERLRDELDGIVAEYKLWPPGLVEGVI